MIDWSAAARPGGRIGHAIEFHPEIGSTNDRALAALDEPGGEGRVILAELQRAGRGRRGRNWQSPTGLNLTFSVALRPRLAATDAGQLAMAAALAVRDACLPEARLAIRWPNDLVATDGRKAAGLLLETALLGDRISHVVIGMGINVNWRHAEMPLEIATSATSLADLGGAKIDRVALLRRLLRSMENEIGELEQGRSPVARYRRASWLDGRRIAVNLGGDELEGVARGVDQHGALLLDTDRGQRVLSSGEVVRVRERPVAVV